ncbi:hypothetical protein MESS4_40006 [Mesorhizobium sp. STM 4661]|nr:hypothetical protein MESS4_40006 [Mesorhizobium sp. STM 4661]
MVRERVCRARPSRRASVLDRGGIALKAHYGAPASSLPTLAGTPSGAAEYGFKWLGHFVLRGGAGPQRSKWVAQFWHRRWNH